MRVRTTATVVLAGAVMVFTAGCGFISPQTTTEHYDASDGFSANVGKIDIRNAIVFTDDGGDTASLSVTIVNNSDKSQKVGFQYDGADGKDTQTVKVKANGEKSLGTQSGDKQLLLSNIDKQPGALLKVFVHYSGQTGKSMDVPVLDGSLPEYSDLLPSPTITPVPGVDTTPTSPATPSDTATPAQ